MKLRITYCNDPASPLQYTVENWDSEQQARAAYESTGAMIYHIEILEVTAQDKTDLAFGTFNLCATHCAPDAATQADCEECPAALGSPEWFDGIDPIPF